MKIPFFAAVPISVSLALLILAVPVHASTIIYNNGGATGGGAEATEWIQADDFTFTQDTVLSDIHFLTIEFIDSIGYQGSVYYLIFGNDALTDTPDETNVLREGLLTPFRFFLVPTTTPGQDFYAYEANIAPLDLAPGTYWLGLHNGPLSNTTRADWYWARTTNTADNSIRTAHEDRAPFDGGWADNGAEFAFSLTTPDRVPEPASVVLLGIGLAGLARMKLRRHRSIAAHTREC